MTAPDPADVAGFRRQLRDLGLHAEADNPQVILALAGTLAAERKRIVMFLRDAAARCRDAAIHASSALDNEAGVRTGRAIDELADQMEGAL